MRYVPTNCLRSGQQLAVNLALDNNRVFLRNGIVLTQPLINRIKEIGFQGAYIDDDISKDLMSANIISDEIKIKAKNEIKSLFTNTENNNDASVNLNMTKLKSVMESMVDQIIKNRRMMVNIVDLRTFDDYTYSHSLNVALLSVVMGAALQMDTRSLRELATAALIHDIGKVFINKTIVNKPQKLTIQEFAEMKMHSEKGYQYLRRYNRLSTLIMRGVLEHHEKYNGDGYPNGLSGDHISIYSRIICVADVYDALTSDRPYRGALIPSEAFEYIMGGFNTQYDPEIVKVFIQKVAPYPIGTCVGLSNGKTGIVIHNHEGYGLRPTVRIIEGEKPTNQIVDLFEGYDKLNITIKQIINL